MRRAGRDLDTDRVALHVPQLTDRLGMSQVFHVAYARPPVLVATRSRHLLLHALCCPPWHVEEWRDRGDLLRVF